MLTSESESELQRFGATTRRSYQPKSRHTFICDEISSTLTPMSPSNFQLIIDAFDDYSRQLGVDLTKNPLADALRCCDSPNAVLELLQDKANAFKDYRDGDPGRTLMNWLKPVVQVVHGFSGVLGPAISLVSPLRSFLLFPFFTLLLLGTIPTSECNLCQRGFSALGTNHVLPSTLIFLISGPIRQLWV